MALAVFGGVSFAQNHQLATGVSVNGTYVGAVANPDVFQQASAFVRTSASEALGYDYNFENEALSTRPVIVANDALISEEALVDKICDANNIVNYTYVLEVNGQAVASGSESALENALKAKLSEYRTENTISVEFTSPISISREIISADEQRVLLRWRSALDATSQEEVIYTVQAGDTWSEIAPVTICPPANCWR